MPSNSPALEAAAKLLKAWGVDVTVHPSAKTNGRPHPFTPIGVIAHHTASHSGASTAAERGAILRGRPPGTPPPLAQILVGRDGAVEVLSYGRANHAGFGGPWRTVPKDSGNRYLIGVEVANDGLTEKYGVEQTRSMHLVYAALLISLKRNTSWLLGHKEWAPGRKPDPKLDMDKLRAQVAQVIAEKTAPPPRPAPASTYTVVTGDTLWDIAQAHGTSVTVLVALNKLKDADELHPGQVLKVPTSKTYTVQRGDTLWAIARKYNTTVAALARLNKLGNANTLAVGQKLRIPG